MIYRECNDCGWIGPETETCMLGSVGPLCPVCRETTEEVQDVEIGKRSDGEGV